VTFVARSTNSSTPADTVALHMNSLFSLVSSNGEVSLADLEEAVLDGDVLIDCLTDEELFWLRQGEATPDLAMDEPYLSSLDERSRQVATDSGLRSLIAKGMVDVDPDEPTTLEFAGAYSVLADLRSSAPIVTRLRLDVPGDESIRYAFSLVTPSLVLTEEVADGGFHDFILQSPSSAAGALAAIFDRHGTAGPTSSRPIRTAHRDDLTPEADDLADRSLHTVLVRSSHGERASFDLAVSVNGTPEGVYLSWSDTGDRPHLRVRLGRTDLEAAALDLILGETPTV
jgi:hypothetical protein